jgi:hypothetical protein
MTAGTSTAMYGSAEAEVQAVIPLCTYLMRTEGKVSKNAAYRGNKVRQDLRSTTMFSHGKARLQTIL